ncbi:hypothetical protein [Limosilactobacillus caviae]|nr:hypothetical protein [Limosilactobacillus caviae]MCD7125311.1 hypothetical protein [Limosilactobacillus caviae]
MAMISYKDCTPDELDYTIGKGGNLTITVNDKKIVLTFSDVPAENSDYMNVKILSEPKHIMASIVIDAYQKDKVDDPETEKMVKEKLANCINTAVKNRFGLI